MFAVAAEIACLIVVCLILEFVRRLCSDPPNTQPERTESMCDTASIQIADEIVEEKVHAGEMFTAFDVSREARKRGSPERHRHLKHVTHAAFTRGDMGTDYTRTLIHFPGVKAGAWLYHHRNDDPSAYRNATATVARRGRSVDGRQRLCVPARSVRQAGLGPGDSVSVTVDAQQQALALTKSHPGIISIATYRVERTGNVRITQRVLRRAGIPGRTFDIADDGATVQVRLV